ncbi:MAG: stage V sporulation protein AA [Roseburia sp.]
MKQGTTTVYIKIEQNIVLHDKRVRLEDIASITSTDEAMVRQLKQMQVFRFPDKKKGKQDYIQVFSVMEIIQMIQKEYSQAEVENIGESDFVLKYIPPQEKNRVYQWIKTAFLCIILFFGASFTIMAFNNDVAVGDIFAKLYRQVFDMESNGFTELEICYSIGLPLGVLLFFNHFGNYKLTSDPTPIDVEMRKYEQDVDTTYIQNASRGGKSIDVD